MPLAMTRRELLGLSGALLFGARCTPADTAEETPPIGPPPVDPAVTAAVHDLLWATPREALLETLAQQIQDGLDRRALVGALLAASCHPIALETHPRAQLQSAYQLATHATRPSDLPLAFAALRVKDKLPSAGPRVGGDGAAGRGRSSADLVAALEAWDAEQAADAVAARVDGGDLSAVVQPLLEYGARRYTWIGHTTIDVVQTVRALELGGWFGAQAVLSVLARALCSGKVVTTESFERNRALVAGSPGAWRGAAADEGAALELAAELRTASPDQAVDAALAMLSDGAGPESVRLACRLAASELTLRFMWPTWIKFPMHAVTTNNALSWAWTHAADERLARLLLLQAVAFVPHNRQMCEGYSSVVPPTGWAIDALEPQGEPPATLDEVFARVSDDRMAAVRGALAWLRAGGEPGEYVAAFRDAAVPHLFEEHQVKLPAATVEEALQSPPHWRERLLASALHYAIEPGTVWADYAAAHGAFEAAT